MRLAGRRFGGDVHARTLVLETETGATAPVKVSTPASGALYDIDIIMQPANAASGSASTSSVAKFCGVSATLGGPTALSSTLAGALTRATVVPQAHGSSAGAGAERIHVFCGGHAATNPGPGRIS
jgi:hypothetical protein